MYYYTVLLTLSSRPLHVWYVDKGDFCIDNMSCIGAAGQMYLELLLQCSGRE